MIGADTDLNIMCIQWLFGIAWPLQLLLISLILRTIVNLEPTKADLDILDAIVFC